MAGKPTGTTLDQIPASSIQSVEVITNPSARYDASGAATTTDEWPVPLLTFPNSPAALFCRLCRPRKSPTC